MSLVAIVNVGVVLLAWRTLHDPATAPRTNAPRFAAPGRAALWLCGCVALGLLCEGAMGDWSGVYLANDLGASPAVAGAGYGAFSAAMFAGESLGGDWFVAGIRPGQDGPLRGGGFGGRNCGRARFAASLGECARLRVGRHRIVECGADCFQRRRSPRVLAGDGRGDGGQRRLFRPVAWTRADRRARDVALGLKLSLWFLAGLRGAPFRTDGAFDRAPRGRTLTAFERTVS